MINTPYKPNMGQKLLTDANKITCDRAFLAHYQVSAADAVVADIDAVLAAVDGAAHLAVIAGITNPAAPRNITATAGGTAGSIKAIQVVITGTNFADEVITETLPAFTVDTAGTVEGNKAFKTITQIDIPAHDAVSATTSIGFGEKLGLPFKLAHNTVLKTFKDNTLEATAPTVTVSATNIESNTIDLNSALNSKIVDTYLIV
jgi:hypothetical protein